VVAVAIVTDPHSDRGEKIQVVRSIRDDPLGWMHSRRQIDDAQLAAGRKWQKLHEISTIGPISAIDPAKEAVDGGEMREPLTNLQIDAFKELSKVSRELGEFGGALVRAVLGRGLSVASAAAEFNFSSKYETEYIGRRFRECLETLAIHWGLAAPKWKT